MRTKRLLLASALLSAVALLAAACGREEGAGGQAAECTAEALQALGASRVDARDFKLAVQKTAGARHLGQQVRHRRRGQVDPGAHAGRPGAHSVITVRDCSRMYWSR